MVEVKVVAEKGYEDIYDSLKEKIANIETEKDAEIEKAVAVINEQFSGKLEKYQKLLAEVSETIEVEVPDEEEVVEEAVEEVEE